MSKTNYILIHGQLVEVSDDVLMHWKYIKREKKNGRWVYYYDESELNKAAADVNKAYGKSFNAAKKVVDAENEVNKARLETSSAWLENKHRAGKNHAYSISEQADSFKKWGKAVDNLSAKEKDLKDAKAAHQKAHAKAEAAEKKYRTKKITTFAARTLSKGAVKVANVLSKLFNKKK